MMWKYVDATDIDLEEIDWDGGTGLLMEFSSRDVAELLVGIKEDHIASTGLNACLSDGVSKTTSTTMNLVRNCLLSCRLL